MGMFDSIYFKCPCCGQEIEAQSKAGDCTLKTISPDEVPTEIADDILHDWVNCPNCDNSYKIGLAPQKEKTVSMVLA